MTGTRYVGRLAPSPTGLLHLGHARTFWIAAQRSRAAAGVLWLRDEDLDPQRSRADFTRAMREDLRWLGIAWDAEMRQSERLIAYREGMQQLVRRGFVYPCTCSRKDLQQAVQAPHEDDDEPIYNGRCRPDREIPASRQRMMANASCMAWLPRTRAAANTIRANTGCRRRTSQSPSATFLF